MGTRGAFGFRSDGINRLTYNHFDSYPDYLGVQMCAAVVAVRGDLDSARANVAAIELVPEFVEEEENTPTPEQLQRVQDAAARIEDAIGEDPVITDLRVSRQTTDDWYCVLRGMHGQPLYWLLHGFPFMIDSNQFVRDSLFCEWGWLINLDDQTLEIYKGFQRSEHSEGRFAELGPLDCEHRTEPYYPIALIAVVPFADIPESEEGIKAMMGAIHTVENEAYEAEREPTREEFETAMREAVAALSV